MKLHHQSVVYSTMFLIPILLISASVTAWETPLGNHNNVQDSLTLTRIDPPAGPGSLAPNLFVDGEFAMLSWLEMVPNEENERPSAGRRSRSYRLRFATHEQGVWSKARTIIEGVPFFANWADIPTVSRSHDGTLIATWAEKVDEATYAYDVRIARSTDDGQTWITLGPAHNDHTPTEHGFVSLVPESHGVRAFWLDGRNMVESEADESENVEDDQGHGPGSMTLRSALIDESITGGILLDDRVCECCGTSAVMTSKGPLIAYRDRSAKEIRDIWYVRYDGMEWTAPAPLHEDNWTIAGCPVNGPALDAQGKHIAAAWYTGAGNTQQVRIAFSDNDGESFGEAFTVDGSRAMGRVDVLLDKDGTAIVCWLDTANMFGALMARRVAPDGVMGKPVVLTSTSTSRSSGFPKLERLGDKLFLIWTEDGDHLAIRGATFPLADIPGLEVP